MAAAPCITSMEREVAASMARPAQILLCVGEDEQPLASAPSPSCSVADEVALESPPMHATPATLPEGGFRGGGPAGEERGRSGLAMDPSSSAAAGSSSRNNGGGGGSRRRSSSEGDSGATGSFGGSPGTSTNPLPDRKRRRRQVGFGQVTVLEHSQELAEDKLPFDGPSVGLGKLERTTIHRVDSYDQRRESERTGVRHIDASERRELVLTIRRAESIDAIEMESEMLRRQRQESALEPISPTMNTAPPGPRLFAPINEADDDIAADATPTCISGACSASARHRSRGGQEEEAEVGISDLWDF